MVIAKHNESTLITLIFMLLKSKTKICFFVFCSIVVIFIKNANVAIIYSIAFIIVFRVANYSNNNCFVWQYQKISTIQLYIPLLNSGNKLIIIQIYLLLGCQFL